jgi:phosphatidylserine/phosphatidylglycerophosphate/cardiolipin synthase-like enzyme
LHSKAYIFDYPEDHHDKGNAIIGSSNLSLGGLSDNTELNALIPGIGNHEKLTAWFNELWDKSEEFRTELMEELLWEATISPLTSFQIVAVKQAQSIFPAKLLYP